MTTATIITTLADDGAMDGDATRQFAAALGVRAGQRTTITVGPCSRTVDQNRLLHAIFNDITKAMREHGVVNPGTKEPYSFETWREYFLDKFLPRKFVPVPKGRDVEQREVRVSSTTLNTAEFSQLVTAIVTDEVLVSRNIFIQLPNEVPR